MSELETSAYADEMDTTTAEDGVVLPDNTMEPPAVIVPDRADAPVSEITERFLRAIVAQVPLERIEELHLFSPLRQSGVETGIAVVAARVPVVVPVLEAAPELPLADIETDTEMLGEPASESEVYADVDVDVDAEVAAYVESDADEDVVESDDETLSVVDDEASDDELVPVSHEPVVVAPIERHTVYTARYRLVQKGPERGKWEADVVAEADAPLITVETVVRGVQRRAGEESEILRFSARQIAKALHITWPLVSPTSETDAPSA